MSEYTDDLSEDEINYFRKVTKIDEDEDEDEDEYEEEDEDEDVNENNMNERERQEKKEKRREREREREIDRLDRLFEKWNARTGQTMKKFVEENKNSTKVTLLSNDYRTASKRKVVVFLEGRHEIREYDEDTDTMSIIHGGNLSLTYCFGGC
jgi:FtsZ-interacting cell division protein YlmF